MLKKLKDKLYNKKMAKKLKNVTLEGLVNIANVPYPVFGYISDENEENVVLVDPQTVEAFKLCVSKLSDGYVSKKSSESFEKLVRDYFKFYEFDFRELKSCMEIYNQQRAMLEKQTKID